MYLDLLFRGENIDPSLCVVWTVEDQHPIFLLWKFWNLLSELSRVALLWEHKKPLTWITQGIEEFRYTIQVRIFHRIWWNHWKFSLTNFQNGRHFVICIYREDRPPSWILKKPPGRKVEKVVISILDPFSLLSAKIQLVTFFPPLGLSAIFSITTGL